MPVPLYLSWRIVEDLLNTAIVLGCVFYLGWRVVSSRDLQLVYA